MFFCHSIKTCHVIVIHYNLLYICDFKKKCWTLTQKKNCLLLVGLVMWLSTKICWVVNIHRCFGFALPSMTVVFDCWYVAICCDLWRVLMIWRITWLLWPWPRDTWGSLFQWPGWSWRKSLRSNKIHWLFIHVPHFDCKFFCWSIKTYLSYV